MKVYTLTLTLLALSGCAVAPVGESVDKNTAVEDASDFTQWAVGCIDALKGSDRSVPENWQEATACLGMMSHADVTLETIDARLEAYAEFDPAAILNDMTTAGNELCVSLVEEAADYDLKRARCHFMVQATIAYQIATRLYDDWDAVLPLLPQSPRAEMGRCTAELQGVVDQGGPTNETLQAYFAWNECVREANEDTLLSVATSDPVAEDDPDYERGLHNRWQWIQAQLLSIEEPTTKLCQLMVAVSDSPEGSIAAQYRAGCHKDMETFLALGIDVVQGVEFWGDPATTAAE